MSYTSSNNIKVFPAVRRTSSYDPFSRLMSESTITSIINRLIDKTGFVISDSVSLDAEFEFSINGYYIKVLNLGDVVSAVPQDATDIYASISLDETSANSMVFTQLVGIDVDGVYNGVDFSTSEPNSTFSLKILTKENDNWVIPEASKIKFTKDTLEFYDIDGGVI